jgi:hypothetical protein
MRFRRCAEERGEEIPEKSKEIKNQKRKWRSH